MPFVNTANHAGQGQLAGVIAAEDNDELASRHVNAYDVEHLQLRQVEVRTEGEPPSTSAKLLDTPWHAFAMAQGV